MELEHCLKNQASHVCKKPDLIKYGPTDYKGIKQKQQLFKEV